MAGPATNAATITVINKVMGKKTLFSYLGSIIGGALFFGVLIDNFLPREWFQIINMGHIEHSHEGHFMLPQWFQITSSIILTLLIINAYFQKYLSNKREIETIEDEEIMVSVIGMSCNHCKNSVETNISKITGVEKATVNLQQKTLLLKGKDIDLEKIEETIKNLGFEYKK